MRLRIAGTPAFAFYDGKGVLLTRYQGAFGAPADLATLGRYVAAGAYESLPFQAYRAQGRIAPTAALPDCTKSPAAQDCICTSSQATSLSSAHRGETTRIAQYPLNEPRSTP